MTERHPNVRSQDTPAGGGAKPADLRRSRVTLAEAMATPIPAGRRSAPVLSHGSMLVALYAPRGKDAQTPHTQDELYIVARGSGWFVNGDARHPFGIGDVLFVPAGVVHRFEQFTDDFAVWVVFYGPEGGESRSPVDAGPA